MSCPGGDESSTCTILPYKDPTPSSFGASSSTKHTNTSLKDLPGANIPALTYLVFYSPPPCNICPGGTLPLGKALGFLMPQYISAPKLQVQRSTGLPGSAPELRRAESSHSCHSSSWAVLSATPSLVAFNDSLKASDPGVAGLRGNREQALALQELGPGTFLDWPLAASGLAGLHEAPSHHPHSHATRLALYPTPSHSACSPS